MHEQQTAQENLIAPKRIKLPQQTRRIQEQQKKRNDLDKGLHLGRLEFLLGADPSPDPELEPTTEPLTLFIPADTLGRAPSIYNERSDFEI